MKLQQAFLLLAASGCAFANQVNTPIGLGFANTCAGDQYFGSLPNPGDGFSTVSDQYLTCQTSTGAPAFASAVNSGIANGHSYSNNATAQAGPGFIKVGASNTGMQAIPFPGAAAYGGWNDQMTIGGGSGSAVWLAPVTLQGDLSAVGIGALTRVGLNAYKNYNFLQPYGGALNSFAYNTFLAANGGPNGIHNSVIGFGWDYQGAWFGAADAGPSDPSSVQHYSLNRTFYFAIPFTYGVQFEFGVYLGGVVGEGSSGAGFTPNSSSYDFTHTIGWAGPGQVVDQSNQSNPNFTLTSQSGYNYNQAFTEATPEPATAGVLTIAVGFLAWLKRRTRQV